MLSYFPQTAVPQVASRGGGDVVGARGMSSRPQRSAKRGRVQGDDDEGEAAIGQKGLAGKESALRSSPRAAAAAPGSGGSSPYAQRERRSKHFADEVGGMASLIPKARKAESPGKPAPSPRGRPRKASEEDVAPARRRGSKEGTEDAEAEAESEEDEEDEEDGDEPQGEGGGGTGGRVAGEAGGVAGKAAPTPAVGAEDGGGDGGGETGGSVGGEHGRVKGQACAAIAAPPKADVAGAALASASHGAAPVTAAATPRPPALAEAPKAGAEHLRMPQRMPRLTQKAYASRVLMHTRKRTPTSIIC